MDLTTITRTGVSTPFYIFALYGDFLIPYKNGVAWTQELVYLLGLLGLPEQTTRTTLARMKQKGWFNVVREGRRSRYELTTLGKTILEEGRQRIFEPPLTDWDETWQLVVYSLPEEKRALRNQLRKKLVWFGFGNLASGTWIAAHDRRSELETIVEQLEIREHVWLFESKHVGMMSNEALVAKCWDVATLAAEYRSFSEVWQPKLAQFEQDGINSAEKQFQECFWLTFDFQPFPRKDPNLPASLLPPTWSGHQARQIFNEYRARLREPLPDFFANLATNNDV